LKNKKKLLESIFLVYTLATEFSDGGLAHHSQNGYTSNIVPFNSTQTLKFTHLRSILTLCAPHTLTQYGVIFIDVALFFTSPAPAPPRTTYEPKPFKATPNVAN